MNSGRAKWQSGFTLLELMITAVIIGILVSIAYPTYVRYVIRSNKVEAQEFMLTVASRAEQYRMDARDYPTDLAADLSLTTPDRLNGNYYVTLTTDNSAKPPSFIISAAPRAGSPQAGEPTLTLNSAGVRMPAEEW